MNLIGQRFGLLLVEGCEQDYVGKTGRHHKMVRCRCDCGNVVIVRLESLKSGRTVSCGCNRKKKLTTRNTKHGLSKHPLYIVWKGIRERCNNKNRADHMSYHDKGIKISEEWNVFKEFYDWAIANGWHKGLEIDRINNSLGYSTSNCRIVSHLENCRNKTNSVMIDYDGLRLSQREWCKILGISDSKLSTIRHRFGITGADAIDIIIANKNNAK